MIEASLIKRYWFTCDGNLLSTNISDKLLKKQNLILVTQIDDGNYISKWKHDHNTWKKLWFSDLKDGKLQFMPGSTEEEIELMQRMYSAILAYEVLEK